MGSTIGGVVQPEQVQLTQDLVLPSYRRPMGDASVWASSAVRKGRLKAVVISGLVTVVIAAAAAFLLALETHPIWGSYPRTSATVLGKSEDHRGKGVSCTVNLMFAPDGVDRTTPVTDAEPCSYMPSSGSRVILAYDPDNLHGVLIVGYDGGIHDAVGGELIVTGMVLLPALGITVTLIRSYRHARSAAAGKPWQEVSGEMKDSRLDAGFTNLLLLMQDVGGKQRGVLFNYMASRLPGFEPQRGTRVLLWLVADGKGNAVMTAPGCPGVADADVSEPNSFELRTLGM